MNTFAYGSTPDQVGDLYLPRAPRPAVICLLHGGFWRLPWGRDHLAAIAVDLAERGFAVWNLEYRRVGSAGGGWPGTLLDVAAGIDHLAILAAQGHPLDLNRVAVVGHSAGGHLALWAAKRDAQSGLQSGSRSGVQSGVHGAAAWQPARVRIAAAVGLAPVADLDLAYELRCGNGAVEDFIGGSPEALPERYRTASPAALLPLGVRQLVVHGIDDEDVPVEVSRRYTRAARDAGDDINYVELALAAHMDFADPASAAHAEVCRWLTRAGV
jgi:acetyl esterase/lipase